MTVFTPTQLAPAQRTIVRNQRVSIAVAPSSALQLWDYQTIDAAVQAHLNGNFRGVAILARSMMMDPAFEAAISKRVHGLVHSPLSFEGEGTGVDLLTQHYPKILPEGELSKLLQWYHLVGVGLGQLIRKFEDGVWMTQLQALDPEHLRFDKITGEWFYNSLEGEIQVTPGDGLWVMLSQYDGSLPCGFAPKLGESWGMKKFALRSWADWNDNAGYPITLGRTPAIVEQEVKEDFAADLSVQRVTKTIVAPEGFDVEILSPASVATYEGMQELVEFVDRKYAVAINGGNLSTEMTQGGSYAAASVHRGVEIERLESDATVISTQLAEQVFADFLRINIGASPVPYPHWCFDEPVEQSQRLGAFNALLDSAGKAAALGFTITNFVEEARELGFELAPRTTNT